MRALSKNQNGFTLIEAIVATALFAITVSSIVGIYVSTLKINRRTDTIRTATETARFLSEFLSKEVRNGQIDYYGPWQSPCSGTLSAVASKLAIVNTDGDHECFYLGDSNGAYNTAGPNLWLIKNSNPAAKVNGSNVAIPAFNVYLSPTINPYASGSSVEPSVSILGTVKANPDPADNISIPFETTISIPAYDIAPPG